MNELLTDPVLIKAIQILGAKLKSPDELVMLNSALTKITIEAALQGEMNAHLGYGKHATEGYNTGNSRNGYNKKTIKSKHGEVTISSPRDRQGQFEPAFIPKYQKRLNEIDKAILTLYAKGMSTRDIEATMFDLYGTEVSSGLVSQVTESVMESVVKWQNRPLDAVYPVLYMDCMVVKVHQDNRVINKALYQPFQGVFL